MSYYLTCKSHEIVSENTIIVYAEKRKSYWFDIKIDYSSWFNKIFFSIKKVKYRCIFDVTKLKNYNDFLWRTWQIYGEKNVKIEHLSYEGHIIGDYLDFNVEYNLRNTKNYNKEIRKLKLKKLTMCAIN